MGSGTNWELPVCGYGKQQHVPGQDLWDALKDVKLKKWVVLRDGVRVVRSTEDTYVSSFAMQIERQILT